MFFLEFLCFLYNPANVGNLISGSSSFSKSSLDSWKFLVCIMLKPNKQNFFFCLQQETFVWSLSQEDSLEERSGNPPSSSGRGSGNPPQYSCLENFMDRGVWQGLALSDYHTLTCIFWYGLKSINEECKNKQDHIKILGWPKSSFEFFHNTCGHSITFH